MPLSCVEAVIIYSENLIEPVHGGGKLEPDGKIRADTILQQYQHYSNLML